MKQGQPCRGRDHCSMDANPSKSCMYHTDNREPMRAVELESETVRSVVLVDTLAGNGAAGRKQAGSPGSSRLFSGSDAKTVNVNNGREVKRRGTQEHGGYKTDVACPRHTEGGSRCSFSCGEFLIGLTVRLTVAATGQRTGKKDQATMPR